MIVRNPFERILSAYRNKFESPNARAEFFHKQIGCDIIKHYRVNATQESLANGDDVTFLEFVQYLMNPDLSMNYNQKRSWNEHWEPMHSLCNPCAVRYDFIGRFENLVEESNLILDEINPEGGLRYPESKYIPVANTKDKLQKYYNQLPFTLIQKIRTVYGPDMLLFNYSIKGLLDFTLD